MTVAPLSAVANGRGHIVLEQSIPELQSGAWQLSSWLITRVLEHPPHRIVFGVLRYRPREQRRILRQEIAAKFYGTDAGPRAHGALQELWRAGFRPPGRHRVARPLGYAADHRILFQSRAPGVRWGDLLSVGGLALDAASAQSATWLLQLQHRRASPVAHGEGPDGANDRLAARELLATFPDASGLRVVTETLLDRLHSPGTPQVLSHGGFHPMNVFTTPRLTTAIDFDKFGRREAAYDVGYAIGRLLTTSYFELGTLAPGARAALAFWRRYERQGPAPWSRVAVQVARFLLQSVHFELCALRKDRPELVPLWVTLMDGWLQSSGPITLERLVSHS